MRRLYPVVLTLIFIAIAYLFAGSMPAIAAAVIGGLVTIALAMGWNPPALLGTDGFSRVKAGISAAWLAVIGVAYNSFLVANWSDNAYLWLALIGDTLILLATIFALAMLPIGRIQRPLYWFGIGALWVLGVVASALLVFALIIIPFQGYSDRQVMLSHVEGLLLLVPSIGVLGYWLPRWRQDKPAEAA